MVKSIDTLPEDIYSLLAGRLVGDDIILDKFGPRLGEVLTQRLKDSQEERIPRLRMSNIGRPLRQLYYELNGYESEPLPGKTLFKFAYGDIIEALIIVLAEASGHKVERLQEELEVDGIKGHIDAVIDGVLVDVKSCSPFSFDKFKDGTLFENDPFGYIGQLSGYAESLKLPARFIAVDKVHGGICTLALPQERIDNYNIRERIAEVRVGISSSSVPERCYEDEPDGKSGNRKLSTGCSYCGYKLGCWKETNEGNGLQVYAYSTGPRYLTVVEREPKTFKINIESNK